MSRYSFFRADLTRGDPAGIFIGGYQSCIDNPAFSRQAPGLRPGVCSIGRTLCPCETFGETNRPRRARPGVRERPEPVMRQQEGGQMPVKSDRWIERMAREKGMIEPFAPGEKREGTVSFGVSAYGYDLRLADEFRLPRELPDVTLDPKAYSDSVLEHRTGTVILPPRSFVLARSLEYFRIPREVIALCFGKSTYARCGVILNVTPLEPEWEGHITMSISNTSPFPVVLHPNEGIAQVVFIESDDICRVSYSDKKGKYQAQKDITPPRV